MVEFHLYPFKQIQSVGDAIEALLLTDEQLKQAAEPPIKLFNQSH